MINWYKIAQLHTFKYLGQCDKLRCNQDGEDKWHEMIREHEKISQDDFLQFADVSSLFDKKDGSFENQLDEFIQADPTSYFAKSIWGNQPCLYIMTHGFEFIFV